MDAVMKVKYNVICAFCGETVLQTDHFLHFDEKSKCRKRKKKPWRIA